jgi:hypothetical protein
MGNRLAGERADALSIRKNKRWKQVIGIGDKITQDFALSPRIPFIEMLEYKAMPGEIKMIERGKRE